MATASHHPFWAPWFPFALLKRSNATGGVCFGKGHVSAEVSRQYVASMEKDHGRALRRFLAARMRAAPADVPDLAQEVYLRLLRIPDYELIRNPRAYLYTI